MENAIIRLEEIGKRYGDAVILDHINLNCYPGKIYGLVGRNGSGKTVLMKIICGFIFPTEGRVVIRGKELGKDMDIPENCAAIIEQPGFLSNYSGYHNLLFLSRIKGKIGKKEIMESLKLVGLEKEMFKKVGKYSMGMRQRLGLAQALMENPEILLLDEPMNGLDDAGVDDMRNVLKRFGEMGATIIISSHNREDIDLLCDEVYRLDRGRMVAQEKGGQK